jgi:hypothetical protein|tara:strand:- start:389 stop:769 length:381 start_codon:yes stop_codon:yes gene_type:complete
MAIVKVVKSIYTGADVTSLGELVSGDTVNLPTGSQVNSSDIVTDADIGVSVQAFDATILVDADIGVNVQAYDSNLTSFVGTFTLPTTDGTADQLLKTNGGGTLSFTTPAPAFTTGKAIAMAIVFGF